MATESKRDKKRRDVLEKLERLHDNRLQRRDDTFKDASDELLNRNHNLTKDPSTVTSLRIPAYMLDLERDALINQIDLHWRYRLRTARKLHEQERTKIEDEHKKGRDAVRQRLLDGVEERRRKIREEKESTGDVVQESLMEAQIRPRPRREPKTSRRPGGPSPPLSQGSTPFGTNAGMGIGTTATLAERVASADSLLAALVPFSSGSAYGYGFGGDGSNGNGGGAGTGSGSGSGGNGFGKGSSNGVRSHAGLFADAIISPLPYSLQVLPAPREAERTGKNARRTAGRGGGGKNGNGAEEAAGGELDSGSFMGQGRSSSSTNANGNGNGGVTGPNGEKPDRDRGNTVIRIGPVMTGYAKVNGWTPGKALEDLKGMVLCGEMEREGDLANIRGWGRRARGAGGRSGLAVQS